MSHLVPDGHGDWNQVGGYQYPWFISEQQERAEAAIAYIKENSLMSQPISQILLRTSQLIEQHIKDLSKSSTQSGVEEVELSAQIYELQQIRKHIEIKAVEYRIDYEESF